jgi:hypothetical protein
VWNVNGQDGGARRVRANAADGERQLGMAGAVAAEDERRLGDGEYRLGNSTRRFAVIEANPTRPGRVLDATGIDAAGNGDVPSVGAHGLGGVGRSARRLAVKLIGAA